MGDLTVLNISNVVHPKKVVSKFKPGQSVVNKYTYIGVVKKSCYFHLMAPRTLDPAVTIVIGWHHGSYFILYSSCTVYKNKQQGLIL